MQKLQKEDIDLIKEILQTPYSTILKEIKDQDYKEKKSLIDMLDTFQKIHKDNPSDTVKDIIINLIADLDTVNHRIDRIKIWLKNEH
jgi:hypothetical protein